MSRIELAGEEVIHEVERSVTNARYLRGETEGRERTRLTNLINGLETILASYAGVFRKMETSKDVVQAAFFVGIGTEAKYREAIDLVQGYLLEYLELKGKPQHAQDRAPQWVRAVFGKRHDDDATTGEFRQARDMNTNAFHIHAPEGGGPLCGTITSLDPTSKPATVEDVLRSRQGEHDSWFWCKDCATDFLFSKNADAFTAKQP